MNDKEPEVKKNNLEPAEEDLAAPDKNIEEDEEIVVVYKKERNPIIKFILGFVAFLLVAYVALFAIGFTMGLMKIEPPNMDPQVATNKWEEITGKKEETPNELEPAENKTNNNISSFDPTQRGRGIAEQGEVK